MRLTAFAQTARYYLTDGGLETYMIFDKGFELPCFSAAVLLDSEAGRQALTAYFERYIEIARKAGRGFVMDVPTWRSGAAWAGPLGQSKAALMEVNRGAVAYMADLRARHESKDLPILLNGVVGPAGDAYAPDTVLSAEAAQDIHAPQIEALAGAGVDMITAMTLTHASEALGIVRAAKVADVPVAIAFTVETDGRLPSGQPLGEAIAEVDLGSDAAAFHFMINCAHPDHFRATLEAGGDWVARLGGLRANASRLSHAELDEAEELDSGNPEELGALHRPLLDLLPNIRVLGGCCGTDHRHVGCLASHDHVRSAA